MEAVSFKPGNLVKLRGREWVVLPEPRDDLLKLRPLGGSDDDATLIYLPLEPKPPVSATFELPDPSKSGSREASQLLRDALRLKLRAGAGPFRSFGHLNFEPRTYQLVPLLMALKLFPVRLLIADDVGIGKTIEAGLIARELFDRGEIRRMVVICPPHLCDQWQRELSEKFNFEIEVIRTGTAARLERGLRPDESVFEAYPCTVVSLDYIKSSRRRDDFIRTCPEFVVVDEAHTCVHGNSNTLHLRQKLLKLLAQSDPPRNILLLTATPHSGDDVAFHNLLGLLNPKFFKLMDMPKGDERKVLRDELSLHFVQRRRGDIKEWEDHTGFPIRENKERHYILTGEWGQLFNDVLGYARTMVKRAEGGTQLQQRMSWWAVLALLRCISSSPAAAQMSLTTQLRSAAGETEKEILANLDRSVRETVVDEIEDALTSSESIPSGTIEVVENSSSLKQLITRAKGLYGPKNDPKLKALIREVRALIRDGFKPVVFCRYIATAHYVQDQLYSALPKKTSHVMVITGELSPSQREEEIGKLQDLPDIIIPVLVATDCLSEGINLQDYFNAVIHYDLAWNPTRHEQRDGRVDRFGQASKIVRTLMLYGKNNPIDGAIIRVILRKADQIRKELGVHVPLPADNEKLLDTVMRYALFQSGAIGTQLSLDFGDTESELDGDWESVKQKMSRTIFAQQSLTPEDVFPEWEKTTSVLGGQKDVERFVRLAADHLGAPLYTRTDYFQFPVQYLPKQLQDRLNEIGFKQTSKIKFTQPPSMGAIYIHRTHPLVSALADYVAEQALNSAQSDFGARCGAMFTRSIMERTVLYLIRLRCQIHVERRDRRSKFSQIQSLLAEECLGIAVRESHTPEVLTDKEAFELLSIEPDRNMPKEQKTFLIHTALEKLESTESVFDQIAHDRSHELLEDHRRIRDASDIKGLRYRIAPCLPVDKIGVYVFMPLADL